MDKKQADDLRHAMAQAAEVVRLAFADVAPAMADVATLLHDAIQGVFFAYTADAITLQEGLRRLRESGALAGFPRTLTTVMQARAQGRGDRSLPRRD